MPPPHPLAALATAGPPYERAALDRLRAELAAHGGDISATAAGLVPPVHRSTVHRWLVTWGADAKKDLADTK